MKKQKGTKKLIKSEIIDLGISDKDLELLIRSTKTIKFDFETIASVFEKYYKNTNVIANSLRNNLIIPAVNYSG